MDGLLALVEQSRRPARAAAVLAAAVVAALVAARPGRTGAIRARRAVVVGSKNFTEQVVLGEILAAALEDRGFAVDRRLNLGGTALCHEAVRSGHLDVYVEYTGTALTDILGRPARSEPRRASCARCAKATPPLGLDRRRAARLQQHLRAGDAPGRVTPARHHGG